MLKKTDIFPSQHYYYSDWKKHSTQTGTQSNTFLLHATATRTHTRTRTLTFELFPWRFFVTAT